MWRNDPDLGAVPAVGKGSVDVGRRTNVGQAVVYDGTDPDALIAFLDDDQIRNIEGELYRSTSEGVLTPMAKLSLPAIIVKPPAGDWFTLTEAQLNQEYAIHVNVPAPKPAEHKPASEHEPVKKAAAKKAPAKKAAPKK